MKKCCQYIYIYIYNTFLLFGFLCFSLAFSLCIFSLSHLFSLPHSFFYPFSYLPPVFLLSLFSSLIFLLFLLSFLLFLSLLIPCLPLLFLPFLLFLIFKKRMTDSHETHIAYTSTYSSCNSFFMFLKLKGYREVLGQTTLHTLPHIHLVILFSCFLN